MRKVLMILILIGLIVLGVTKAASARNNYQILVDFSDFKLTLFNGRGEKLAAFPVALPEFIPNLPIEGRVKKIVRNPYWYPTSKTRRDYFLEKRIELPSVVKPGTPANPMGVAKIIIVFETVHIHPTIRIHGTPDLKSIGRRASRGCIRLNNQDILTLIDFIKGKPILVLFKK